MYTGVNCDSEGYCNFQEYAHDSKNLVQVVGKPVSIWLVDVEVYGDGFFLAKYFKIDQCETFGSNLDLRPFKQLRIVMLQKGTSVIITDIRFHISCETGLFLNDEFGSIQIVNFQLESQVNDSVCNSSSYSHVPTIMDDSDSTLVNLPEQCTICHRNNIIRIRSLTLQVRIQAAVTFFYNSNPKLSDLATIS